MAQTSNYRLAVIDDMPVFYAPLDESSAPKDRKSGAVLEEVNGPTGATSFDSGWTFNGTDECLLVAATDLDQVAGYIGVTGEFSLECWFKANDGWTPEGRRYGFRWGGYGVFISFYGFSTSDQTGYVQGGFYDPDAAERNVEEHGTWFNNAWHHVVVTFDRPTLSLYVDGNLVQQETRDFEVQITDTESDFLGIGREGPFSSGFFPGSVDDVAIYNYALTETQIDTHFAASRTEKTDTEPDIDDPPGGSPRTPPEGIASSFHATWNTDFGDEDGLVISASVDLTVLVEPQVDDLYFWALQCSFYDDEGTLYGGAHTGLQWNSSHPDNKAVNWGGYDTDQVELSGSESEFPSTPGNDNTRDYEWTVGETYTFVIELENIGIATVATATVNGELIRGLFLPPEVNRIGDLIMWSEVFAQCSDPSVTVKWTNMTVTDVNEVEYEETEFKLNYQAEENNGCLNTNTFEYNRSIRQQTNTTRTNPQDAILTLQEIEVGDSGAFGVGFIGIT